MVPPLLLVLLLLVCHTPLLHASAPAITISPRRPYTCPRQVTLNVALRVDGADGGGVTGAVGHVTASIPLPRGEAIAEAFRTRTPHTPRLLVLVLRMLLVLVLLWLVRILDRLHPAPAPAPAAPETDRPTHRRGSPPGVRGVPAAKGGCGGGHCAAHHLRASVRHDPLLLLLLLSLLRSP